MVNAGNPTRVRDRGFGLIEGLVVAAVVAVLVAVAVPSLAMVRQRAVRLNCADQLHRMGVLIDAWRADHHGVYPRARYMPEPFLSGDPDPGLPEVLKPYLQGRGWFPEQVLRCPGDRDHVFTRSGISYMYRVGISGQTIQEYYPVRAWGLEASEIPVANDFDGGSFDLSSGGKLNVPFFHDLRNLLFADGHVGQF